MAFLEANRGTAIDDRATLAAFMDQEAAAFARGLVDDYTPRDDYALLRGAMHAGLAAIVERFVMSANVPSLAQALVATS